MMPRQRPRKRLTPTTWPTPTPTAGASGEEDVGTDGCSETVPTGVELPRGLGLLRPAAASAVPAAAATITTEAAITVLIIRV